MWKPLERFLGKNYKKRILLISSTTSSSDNEDTFDYFASIISELAFKIQNKFPAYDFVLKVPEGDGQQAVNQQIRFIEDAISNPDPYECVIISPVNRDLLYSNMRGWIENHKRQVGVNRLIIIDQGFSVDDYQYFHTDDVSRPPYVQADWRGGGRVAGDSMSKYFVAQNIKRPHVVLLEGNIGSAQRIAGFRNAMDNSNGNFEWTSYSCKGDYSKKAAKESFEKYLIGCIAEKKAIDGIFATNDEMALGVRDALVTFKTEYTNTFSALGHPKLPIIIGFDGIKDLTFYIDNKDIFIYDTVNVQLKKQIDCLSKLVEKLIISKEDLTENEKFVYMECLSYRVLKNMPV